IKQIKEQDYPAYTSSAGWLGYLGEKIQRLCREAINEGFTHLKIKVGRDLQDDIRRLKIIRQKVGYDRHIMIDANQVWDIDQAIEWMKYLVEFHPYWIEEPTSPDDILGHARISQALQLYNIGVATGGVNEVLAVLLLAAKFRVPVCPHAGGVGLCELVQHLSMIDFVVVSGTWENRVIEF
ncbi:unnamed protein product, partial [Rotaria sp. Silwood1]